MSQKLKLKIGQLPKIHSAKRLAQTAPSSNDNAALPGRSSIKNWLFAIVLFGAVFLAYQPAWRGEFIWDDDGHVTSAELRSAQGLYRIWFELGTTQQYYPLVHKRAWLEHKPLGRRAAWLSSGKPVAARPCGRAGSLAAATVGDSRQLARRGDLALFYPVNVESVAWITEELKNTLSAVFFLAAALAYLRFDRTPQGPAGIWRGGLGYLRSAC